MEKEYVKLWVSYEAYFEPLSPEEVGRLVLGMLKYKTRGEEPVLSGNERFVWPAIRRDIDAQTEAQHTLSAARSAAGKKGGRPPKAEGCEKAKKPSAFAKSNGQGQEQGQGQGERGQGPLENVLLTRQEQARLEERLGDAGARAYIDRLSLYLAQSGKRYKSHYAALLNWWNRDGRPVARSAEAGPVKPDRERKITPDMTAEELF